jgi:glycyl-tRNA synthetase
MAMELAKRRGFAFQSGEIYGGIRSGSSSIVQLRDDVVGQDAAIIMAPRVWEASGHLESFSDPLVECT